MESSTAVTCIVQLKQSFIATPIAISLNVGSGTRNRVFLKHLSLQRLHDIASMPPNDLGWSTSLSVLQLKNELWSPGDSSDWEVQVCRTRGFSFFGGRESLRNNERCPI